MKLKLLTLSIFLIITTIIFADDIQVGKISGISNSNNIIIKHNGKDEPVTMMKPIYLNDEVITSTSGSVSILLNDNSVFSLTPNSDIVIDEFAFDDKDANLKLSVKTGLIAGITGDIVKRNPDKFKVVSPRIILGIRGTTFFINVPNGNKPELAGIINIDSDHSINVNGMDISENLTAVEVVDNKTVPKKVQIPSNILISISNAVPLTSDKSKLTYILDYNKDNIVYQQLINGSTVKSPCSSEPIYFQSQGLGETYKIITYSDDMCSRIIDNVELKVASPSKAVVNSIQFKKMFDKNYQLKYERNGIVYKNLKIGALVRKETGVYFAKLTSEDNKKTLYGYIKINYVYKNDTLESNSKLFLSESKVGYSSSLFNGKMEKVIKNDNSEFSNMMFLVK